MNAWLLQTIPLEERTYHGNEGYFEDPEKYYRYDSFVPHHKNVSMGDLVLLRTKKILFGNATIQAISKEIGPKQQLRCPKCDRTTVRIRKKKLPKYRCYDKRCEYCFDTPVITVAQCTLFKADFGFSYKRFDPVLSVNDITSAIVRPNMQHAIQKLDFPKLSALLQGAEVHFQEPSGNPYFTNLHRCVEGGLRTSTSQKPGRSKDARNQCLAHYGNFCQVCGIDYSKIYGLLGRGLIEVHHLVPLSEVTERYSVDPINDLLPVCPNCHEILHRGYPSLSYREIKKRLNIPDTLREKTQ